jgi:DUF438 domain-containing protein
MKTNETGRKKLSADMIELAMDGMGLTVSIIDSQGMLLYYNQHAAAILDRKPEYIGRDVHSHHKKASSNEKLDLMLQAFENGRTEPFHYEANPYGKDILVALSPLLKDGRFLGCVQSVVMKEALLSERGR